MPKREMPANWGGVHVNPDPPEEREAIELCDFLEANYDRCKNCMGDARVMHMNAPGERVQKRAAEIMEQQRDWEISFDPFQQDTHTEFGVVGGEFWMKPIGKRRRAMGL